MEPVIAGHDEFDVNPALLVRPNVREGKVNCALPTTVAMPFAEQFQILHSVYDKSDNKAITPEQVISFQILLYMEIQY